MNSSVTVAMDFIDFIRHIALHYSHGVLKWMVAGMGAMESQWDDYLLSRKRCPSGSF
jgi:hypothetical protein